MKQRIILILTFLVSFIHISAQTKVNIKAADSLKFHLFINDQPVNNIPCTSITLVEQPAGKTVYALTFPNNETLNINQNLTFKKNTSVFYEVGQSKTGLKLNLVSESVYTPLTKEVIKTEIELQAELTEDAPELIETGNKITAQEFDRLTAAVKETHFEQKKLDKITNTLDSRTISVDQLRYLMALLDTEDSKLLLLTNLKNKISDPARLNSVSEDFFLQKNKEKVTLILAE